MRRVTSSLYLVLLLLQHIIPFFSLVSSVLAQSVVAEAASPVSANNLPFVYDSATHQFQFSAKDAKKLSYELTYLRDGEITEQVLGSEDGENGIVQTSVYAGTCSDAACTPHAVIAATAEVEISQAEGGAKTETYQLSQHAGQWWMRQGSSWSVNVVKLNTAYYFPEQPEVSLTFTKLPAQAGSLTIEVLSLSESQVEEFGALSSTAYQITSSMTDGSFEYDLHLPVPSSSTTNTETATIKYAETIDELATAVALDEVSIVDQKIIAEGVDHFTVFIVADPGAGSNDNSAGSNVWFTVPLNTYAARIQSSNNAYAFALVDGSTSNYLVANDFGFSIPSNAVITGITATVEKGSSLNFNGGTRDAVVQLTKAGVNTGDNKANLVSSYPVLSDTVSTYGSPTDLWGTTWTPAEINDAQFGLAFAVSKPNAAGLPHLARVDHIDVRVSYVVIDVTAPNGGEVYQGGSTQNITWTAPDTDGLDDSTIDLAYTTDGVIFTPIATGLANSGSYAWTTPLITSSTVQVRATVTDGVHSTVSAIDLSDADFTIDSTPPAQPLFWVEEDTSSVVLNWATVADADSYAIYRDGAVLSSGVVGTTFTDLTAGANTLHTYEVRAVDAALNESAAQTAKTAQTFDLVIDDTSRATDVNATGSFATSGSWSGFGAVDGGFAGLVLQNAVGGDNFSTIGAASGQTATWTTTATLDGLYDVYVQNICDSSRGQAQYQISSGPFVVGQVTYNQNTTDGTTVCGSQAATSVAGPQWVRLGSFPIVNAQAAVRLTAPNGQQNILADAVAFEYVSPYASIQGRKYNDVNGNANFDSEESSEPGRINHLNGWTISLYRDLAQAPVASMVTGDDTTLAGTVGKGQYRFTGLSAGTYYVCETQQAGWVQTERTTNFANPNGDGTFCREVTLATGQNVVGRQFGNFQLNTATGMKFNDLSADGVKQNSEPGLLNWEIRLTGTTTQGSPVSLTTNTDGNGNYSFANLDRGSYTVCEVDQADWTQTYPTDNAGCYAIEVTTSGQSWSELDFGNAQEGSIQGRKFDDLNADGTRDSGNEPVLNGWTVTLYKFIDCGCFWEVVSSMVTGDDSTSAGNVRNGQYRFTGLLTGTYAVCETPQTGWVQTRPWSTHPRAIAANLVDPTLTTPNLFCLWTNLRPNQDRRALSFGNFKLAEVYGSKFNDSNRNRIWDKSEPGIANWTIRLTGTDINGDSVNQTVVTDLNGDYAFAGDQGLYAGTYQICEVNRNDWTQTTPSGTGCYELEITQSGEIHTDLVFGNVYTPPSSGGSSGSGSTGGSGGVSTPTCTEAAPSSAPGNFRVISSGTNTVTLAWNAVNPTTHYGLVFTRLSDGAQYGATNIGNVTTYTINGISGGASYSFELFAANGCATGPRAVISTQRISGPVLAGRPVSQSGLVLGETVEYVEATASASVSAQNERSLPAVAGEETCREPWWKWLLPLILAVVLVITGWFARQQTRTIRLSVNGILSVVVAVIGWLYLCAFVPWIYLVAVIAIAGAIVTVLSPVPATSNQAKPKKQK